MVKILIKKCKINGNALTRILNNKMLKVSNYSLSILLYCLLYL
ncbi:hypothetical protein SAMN05216324_1024 [Chryseobacterium limigenitum]|uniref:Uncharacterized protein n=1 Tax=Chryseobacterium limigenitum TaxID=1612149 RepID=A0A1K2IF33_9FLAO|nr:hypothetical protein SAMN05216324_1024 [Chryseobacterium limigenitum]